MILSDRLHAFRSLHACGLGTRVLTFPLMGLPPTEHICLFWTYTEAPSLHRHYPTLSVLRAPLRHPKRPGLSLASCQFDPKLRSPLGLPVLRMVPSACMLSPIPRQVGWNLFARTIPFASAFREIGAGRLQHQRFRGLLSVHSLRPARSPRRLATLCTRGFSSLVASPAALIATGWSEPVPGRLNC
jgi:hypothetical protein